MLNVVYLMCFAQTSFTYKHLCYMAQYNCKQNQDEEVEHTHSCKFFFLEVRKYIFFPSVLEPTALKRPQNMQMLKQKLWCLWRAVTIKWR